MRRLDPEPLAVWARGRVLAPPVRGRDHGQRRHREKPADQAPEKPIVCDAAARRTKTTLRRSRAIAPSVESSSYQPPASLASLSVDATACLRASSCPALSLATITCPPSKPISTRCASLLRSFSPISSLRRLDDLGQHASGRLRVQEGDPAAADSSSRLLVDQLHPGSLELVERGIDVVDSVGHVVQTLAPPLDEPAHGRLRA